MAKVPILITLLPQLFCMLLEVFGQSPCPQYFMYINDPITDEVMGQVQIPSPPKNVELHLRVALSIAVELPSAYVGRLELAQSKEESVRVVQQGKPLLYHIHFPVSQPFPLLTGLIFNGQVYCSGLRAMGRVVTSIVLEHTLYPPNVVPLSQNSYPIHATRPTNRPTTQRPKKKPTTIHPITTIDLSEGINNNMFLNSAQQNANNVCGVSTHTNDINLLISKGVETSPGQWPWLVAIFIVKLEFKFQCAGSLVTNKHIITAAHCCKIDQTNHNVPPSVLYVSLGRYRLREWYEPGSVNREIVSYTIHPDYTHMGNGDSDLAILVLRTPVQFSPTIKPVCMWFGQTNLQSVVNKSGYVIGWGRDEFGNPYLAEPRMTRVPIVSQEECLWSDMRFAGFTSNRTFCAGLRDGSGPCNGDSGSGLVLHDATGRYQLRGIVSRSLYDHNELTCDLTQYVIYVDVAKYISWIQQQISTT
ncbi:serine protease gd-like isoform X2 [Linepithema humile]|nr:PREDICTED: serine protease gd-like isoform X1 [Linepithema humile]XP_012221793.1 PREDICTED: serine protease gd-like isoform X1 [Linepithema humile]XP_012221794.1 PREDICTED: serine protease gd-like isoform X1 [Linepithema humile]XP_012221795.1 PREDICTED: serine protease gd-like isoform X1 [Linepithema humile]XP_012221796.1 PREDICTED: serine protease gd-like isoform X1 [Linepithema humile]XP_012221797.1 PREDICTED: serine protease gd-like isoform X1 [Linepithema humile]XP_012221798.1 PREDICTE